MLDLIQIILFYTVTTEQKRNLAGQNERITLECKVTGVEERDQCPLVTWKKRNHTNKYVKNIFNKGIWEWNEDTKILITSLTIECANGNDSGFYTCVLTKNNNTLQSEEMQLHVLGSKSCNTWKLCNIIFIQIVCKDSSTNISIYLMHVYINAFVQLNNCYCVVLKQRIYLIMFQIIKNRELNPI